MELMGGDIGALAKALAAAQGEMENAVKDGKNPHYGSAFATLASVRGVVSGPLSKHGIAVTQHPSTDGASVTVHTLLLHESGGWLAASSSALAKDGGPQAVGSVISYLRRYSLAAVCGIAQEDDDGEAASQPDRGSRPRAVEGGKASAKQMEYLDRLMKSSVFTDAEREKVGKKIASEDKKIVSGAIEWAKSELDARKAVEDAEKEGAA